MFKRLFIANRGEIACRIIRTAQRMGLTAIVGYSDADRDSLAVQMADEAYRLGAAPAQDSYLNVNALLSCLRDSNADALHPGYGFLSENADFAAEVMNAGCTFIGPPLAAIRAMGSKADAKQLLETHEVPFVPGYHGADQSPDFLLRQATSIGFPLLIKVAAGGGGKGMRIVGSPDKFPELLAAAKREGMAAFGDDRVILERYLPNARHIECQIFADRQSNVVHLFERDCSLQRRHQKIIEEAPATGLLDDVRNALYATSKTIAQTIGYEGAGTIEYLVSGDDFYFLEMNTRLQVEHPVSEMITGLDLVEWQLRVAAGEGLPLSQDDIQMQGHALEARVYAENPAENFMPSSGTILRLAIPNETAHLRIDSGIQQGDSITTYYDPMIFKVIVWGPKRGVAIKRLEMALAKIKCVGPETNVSFLEQVLQSDAFQNAEISTTFLDTHLSRFITPENPPDRTDITLAVAAYLWREERPKEQTSHFPFSNPWDARDTWRANLAKQRTMTFLQGNTVYEPLLTWVEDRIDIAMNGWEEEIRFFQQETSGFLRVHMKDKSYTAYVDSRGRDLLLTRHRHTLVFQRPDPLSREMDEAAASQRVIAPMPGKLIQILAEKGQEVQKGDVLLILEAMKMEYALTAPSKGCVEEVYFKVGDQVEEGVELLNFTADKTQTD